jgi:hypothetical protein
VEDGSAPTCGNQSGWWRRLAVAGADGGGGMQWLEPMVVVAFVRVLPLMSVSVCSH